MFHKDVDDAWLIGPRSESLNYVFESIDGLGDGLESTTVSNSPEASLTEFARALSISSRVMSKL